MLLKRLLAPDSFHRSKLHDTLGPRFRHVNQPVISDGNVVHRIEHRAARLSEADRGDNVPVAIELQHAGVLSIVIGRAALRSVDSFKVACVSAQPKVSRLPVRNGSRRRAKAAAEHARLTRGNTIRPRIT